MRGIERTTNKSAGLFIVLLGFLTASCSFFTSVSDRFNAAFPPSAEVRVAEETLRTYLRSDSKALQSLDHQYEERLELRTMTCSMGLAIGRLDSADTIRKMPVPRSCLQEQDTKLLEFLGIRQVAARLSKPPLRPLTPLGPPAIASTGKISAVSAIGASAAGIALIQGSMSEFVSVAIPGGNMITDLPPIPSAEHDVSISPNGRVAAFPQRQQGTLFVDLETGEKLWTAPNLGEVLVWIPELQAALANESNGNVLQIVDFQIGTIAPHPLGLRQQTWGLNITAKPLRVVVGGSRLISVLQGARGTTGIEMSVVKALSIRSGQGVTSTWPTLMNNGRSLLFVSVRDYAIVDLQSGEERFIESAGFMRNQYAKYSETEILVDTLDSTGWATKPWLLDIEQMTLAPVLTEEAKSGILMPLAGRTGFVRRESQIWFGDELRAGDHVPLEKAQRSFNMEKQLAELAAAEARANSGGAFEGMSGRVIAPYAPRDAIARPFTAVALKLSANATVEAVGVYEPAGRSISARMNREPGPITVYVKPSRTPIVLVLSSYEAVSWQIKVMTGAKLEGVLYGGYEESNVVGAGAVPVQKIGQVFAYEKKLPRYAELDRLQANITGRPINTFQGLYAANTFVVGGR